MIQRWVKLRLIQIIFDILGIFGCFVLAYFLRVGWIFSSDFPIHIYLIMSVFATLIWMSFLLFAKLYRLPPRNLIADIAIIFIGGLLAVGMLIVSYFFPREILFSRLIGVYIFIFGSCYLIISNILFRQQLIHEKKTLKNKIYQTLVIGANRISENLIDAFAHDKFAPFKIIGVLDPYGISREIRNGKILGKLDQLETICEKNNISCIIQCDAFEHTINIISFCDEKNIKFMFEPHLRGIFEKNLRIREIAGQKMISFVQRDFYGVRKGVYSIIDWMLVHVFDVD